MYPVRQYDHTPEGRGKVVRQNILQGEIAGRTEDGKEITVSIKRLVAFNFFIKKEERWKKNICSYRTAIYYVNAATSTLAMLIQQSSRCPCQVSTACPEYKIVFCYRYG